MVATTEPLTRETFPAEALWDLSGLFPADDRWNAEFAELESMLPGYEKLRGTLGRSAGNLQACLEFDMNLMRKLDKVYTYAHLRTDEDKTRTADQERYDRAMRLVTRISQARSFMDSEIMSIPRETMGAFLDAEELKFYRLHLERILRHREHTLSEKEESILAASSEIARAARNGFDMLDNADLKLGTVQGTGGEEIRITHGNFQSLMQNYDRRVRKEAFETFYSAYRDHRFTYASLLASSIRKDLFYSRTRNYPSVREQGLFEENIPVEVYDNLIRTVHDNLDPLYRYFALRKKILNLDELHVYDCAVPLVKDIRWNMTYEESVGKISQALQPLGKEYVSTLEQGLLQGRWVDRYETPGKRSGAYSSGCYDSNPFILMNYLDDNINSLYTLGHEAGHSMHSYYSRKNQPYLYAGYTIFVAEVASTFNEALITRHLLQEKIGREMKIYLLSREIDNFRGTLYRQTMFAEFEHLVYAMAERDEPLTVDSFQEVYGKLLSLYFGKDLILDKDLPLECFRIPHFYFSFYVYKYATGISAAYALADRVLEDGKPALEAYLGFLRSGGSKYPIDLLKDAGVDMTSPEPIRTALNKFSDLVGQLEALFVH
ncbi:MAG: oligoendopeptidase F [Nitrospinae bacterium CG11_big_fil_rev_8_21_14_0_20_56_8]|nr:MAG: oligoendopeptidase F [Nitrospinae bacterium CG11_big_fil_rev_8_21_14_0_20_56_8]